MSDLPRIDMGDPPFTQMLARSVFDGAILAALLPPLAIVAAPLFGGGADSVPSPIGLILAMIPAVFIGSIVVMLIAVAIMAPLAALFAWPLYRRGVKSYAVYIALGALVGILTPLLLALMFSAPIEGDRSQLLFVAWFVVSSAFGGWSFADQLSRQTNPANGA